MVHILILAAIALLPAALILLLKSNAAISFMSLCVGSVLVTYTANDVSSVATGFSRGSVLSVNDSVKLALLIAPFILTLLFTRKSVKGSHLILNAIPALASGLLFALLVVPLLSAPLQRSIETQSYWHQLSNLQTAVVLGGALFSLIFILANHRSARKLEGKHSKTH